MTGKNGSVPASTSSSSRMLSAQARRAARPSPRHTAQTPSRCAAAARTAGAPASWARVRASPRAVLAPSHAPLIQSRTACCPCAYASAAGSGRRWCIRTSCPAMSSRGEPSPRRIASTARPISARARCGEGSGAAARASSSHRRPSARCPRSGQNERRAAARRSASSGSWRSRERSAARRLPWSASSSSDAAPETPVGGSRSRASASAR